MIENKIKKIKKYLELIDKSRYSNEIKIKDVTFCMCDYKEDNVPPALNEFVPYEYDSYWGDKDDSHAWFHFTIKVPEELKNKPVILKINTDKSGWDAVNPQGLLYINGKTIQGLDVNHTNYMIDSDIENDVYVYAYTGQKISTTKFYASIMNINIDSEQLWYDIRVPFELLDVLRTDSEEYAKIVDYLWKAVSMLDLYQIDSEEFYESISAAHQFLTEEFYNKYCNDKKATTVICIGHTHIDCAWRWTLRQTREKVQRSFSTVLQLMKQYPEYKFMSSQPLLYKFFKETSPELYNELKQRVKEGRWEVEGAMWVEPDCNLISGESMVRQLIHGKTFIKDEFGVNSHVLWLPDVFGYSAALPQILRKAGVDWFVTSKISWNDTNSMPYDTFKWIGIDGTEINTFFITAQDRQKALEKGGFNSRCTYNGNTSSKMVLGTWERYLHKDLNNEALLPFGYGDGGGGPTADYLEMQRRTSKGLPGVPVSKIDFTSSFLKKLGDNIEKRPDIVPKWRGELYLEFHRGTYTSIAKNKRKNRFSEFQYGEAEMLSVIGKNLFDLPFPKSELYHGWEMILTNQFHDIIPGSSIKEVYDQSDKDYIEINTIGENIINSIKKRIADSIEDDGSYVVFNPHSFVGNGYTKIDNKTVYIEGIPSKGFKAIKEYKNTNTVSINGNQVETEYFIVRFDPKWMIESIYDKKNEREIITSEAKANEIRCYPDYPDVYDAWEWKPYSLETYKVIDDVDNTEIIDDGARKGIKITRKHMDSVIYQTIWFYDEINRIDFETTVDWHQKHQMIKAAFPVNINSDVATFEIQFGRISRPTHKNTSWDEAKFETCGHKYADLSEGNYGVSILNDCKYGHDIHDGVIMLSLLKCATAPNPEADQGIMNFTYSIVPHKGTLNDSDVVKQAYYLNYPMTAVKASGKRSLIPSQFSLIDIEKENIICDTIKEAEDSSDVIVRLYESSNSLTKTRFMFNDKDYKIFECDLMENNIKEISVENGSAELIFKPFEIKTLKISH